MKKEGSKILLRTLLKRPSLLFTIALLSLFTGVILSLDQKETVRSQSSNPSTPSGEEKGVTTTGSLADATPTKAATAAPNQMASSHSQGRSNKTTTDNLSTTIEAKSEIASPTPTETPMESPSPTPTVTPIPSLIFLKIETPEGKNEFGLTFKNGENICDLLKRAKDEGKITSVTIDESFLPTLKSAYVAEINGYRNNWTFTVNGVSPRGCSLYTLNENDVVVWKFN